MNAKMALIEKLGDRFTDAIVELEFCEVCNRSLGAGSEWTGELERECEILAIALALNLKANGMPYDDLHW